MFISALAFLAGDIFLQYCTKLPSLTFGFLLLIFSISILVISKFNRFAFIICMLMFGFTWSLWIAHQYLSWQLPKEIENTNIIVSGKIASIPVQQTYGTQFNFYVESIEKGQQTYPAKILIRLTWHDCPYPLQVGSQYQLVVRIKRLHGLQSPGAFDVEKWGLLNNIHAKGYVVKSSLNTFIMTSFSFYLHQIRQHLFYRLKEILTDIPLAHWMIALIIGERQNIPSADWEVLRKTGTNHLMAIAGLHIAIVAGISHYVFAWLWRRRAKNLLILPANQAGIIAALIIAIIYSALAGFSLPTQRACIMFCIFVITFLQKRKINPWHNWAFALATVLFINPYQIFTCSFWLSFSTIALIIFSMNNRLGINNFWWKWGRMQWVIGIGLIPISLEIFQEFSILSCVANIIAIPWMSFIILPLCLLACLSMFFLPKLAYLLFWMASKSLQGLWWFLTNLAAIPFSSWNYALPNDWLMFFIGFIIFLFLLPRGFKGKLFTLFIFIPVLFPKTIKPDKGDIWLTVLDVGQGLSLIVQTQNHVLVFDTGAKYNAEIDMAKSIIIPYFHSYNIRNIDSLIISHGDNDHLGGAASLAKSYKIDHYYTSDPEKLLHHAHIQRADYCDDSLHWTWDDVNFQFLYPAKDKLDLGNNSSCVLMIDNAYTKVLFTGDIEKLAENYLVDHQAIKANILIAPHHGSKTSSTEKFIQAVQPNLVIFSTGYLNRYHFPHPGVVARYNKYNIKQLNTVDTGTITLKLSGYKKAFKIAAHRWVNRRYWM